MGLFSRSLKVEMCVFQDADGKLVLFHRIPSIKQNVPGAYDYFCPKCGKELTDGPEGGGTRMAKCEGCDTAYSGLEGFFGS